MDKVTTRVFSKWEEGSGEVLKGLPVRITLKDGRTFEHITARDMILGGAKNPWGFDNIKGKFEVNAGLALAAEQVAETMQTWSDLGESNRPPPRHPQHPGRRGEVGAAGRHRETDKGIRGAPRRQGAVPPKLAGGSYA